jgi:type I restriction enzyme S subunit
MSDLLAREPGAIRIGPFGSALKKNEYSEAGIRVLGIDDVLTRGNPRRPKFIPEAKYRELTQYRVRAGDILVTNMGTVGRAFLVPAGFETAIISSHLIKVTPDLASVDAHYLEWALNAAPAVVAQIVRDSRGAIMAGFNTSRLKALAIPLPSLAEQRRIADILDRADAVRAKRRVTLERLNSLPGAIYVSMFGHPSGSPGGPASGRLGDMVKTTSGGTPNRAEAAYYGGNIPWVKSGELQGSLVTTTEEHLTQRGLIESSAKLMPPGTVLVAMYGATAGAVATLGVSAATNQAICCIEPTHDLTGPFLAQTLKLLGPSLLGQRVGGAQPNLSQDLIRKLEIPVPPAEQQAQFEIQVARAWTLRTRFAASLSHLDALFASLQHLAFRGEL